MSLHLSQFQFRVDPNSVLILVLMIDTCHVVGCVDVRICCEYSILLQSTRAITFAVIDLSPGLSSTGSCKEVSL